MGDLTVRSGWWVGRVAPSGRAEAGWPAGGAGLGQLLGSPNWAMLQGGGRCGRAGGRGGQGPSA
jgi:hypothetical protein